jgi:spore germination protein YaaH/flagellar hook assembly protein FlgD
MSQRPPSPRSMHAARLRLMALIAGVALLTAMTPIGAAGAGSAANGISAPDSPMAVATTDNGIGAQAGDPDPAVPALGPNPTLTDPPAGEVQPTIQYEEAVAHANDKTAFTAGARVTVPFKPRPSDRWTVGGVAPQALPAGRLSGRAMRRAQLPASDPLGTAGHAPGPYVGPFGRAIGAADVPDVDPAGAPSAHLAAAVDPGGLKREVFGFLPYWELTDPSTRLDWEDLSTIAYFGVGAAGNGDLQKKNSDGSTTVGWSGWTSSKMTGVINAAHASGARVVLTVQSFAWTSAGVARQKALLGSSSARSNLARQIAAAVRDRGADGVNLDFEPIISGYGDEFTALVRSVRANLNVIARGYQLTFDSTGWIGNYPIENATASGGADAVVVMGYDYRGSSSNPVGSVAPIGGPSYDVGDTIRSYVARLPASKVILGVPYYGRAWSTASTALHAANISGTKYGSSTTVVYGTAAQYAADHGRRWDPVEGVAWTVYHRQNCTATYGCVNPVREIYYDDDRALGLKYDLINRYNLRGAGIWALGYDGTRSELYGLLKAKFITDMVPPAITGATLSSSIISPNGDGRLDTATMRVTVTGELTYGWAVQPYFDGIAGKAVRTGSATGKNVAFQWDGRNSAGAVVPDGPYRITMWTADASNNQALIRKVVTVDRRAAVITDSSVPGFISPNGDGHTDKIALSMASDSPITGSARLLDKYGHGVRGWAFTNVKSTTWVWNGRDSAGRTVPDSRYTLRVWGLDAAGNSTIRDMMVRVDRTIRSVTRTRASFIPRSGQTTHVSFTLSRAATVTFAIQSGSSVVRPIWQARAFAAGSYGWTWNGRTAAGAFVAPGTYHVVVTATSWIGTSTFSQSIVVKAP